MPAIETPKFSPVIYVADVGSVAKGKFGWASSDDAKEVFELSLERSQPDALVARIAAHLNEGRQVALGWECPLFVPLPDESKLLGKARQGECQAATGNRPFTAGAGASLLATGIQSLAWVLKRIKQIAPTATATTDWHAFQRHEAMLLVWEAFVSGSEKAYPPSDLGDAKLAVEAFKSATATGPSINRIADTKVLSFAGAAILQAGLSFDIKLLDRPCHVLRPIFTTAESEKRLVAHKLRRKSGASRGSPTI